MGEPGPVDARPTGPVDVRLAGAGDSPAVAALRAAWIEEWHGGAERSLPFYRRAGFAPAMSLLMTELDA